MAQWRNGATALSGAYEASASNLASNFKFNSNYHYNYIDYYFYNYL